MNRKLLPLLLCFLALCSLTGCLFNSDNGLFCLPQLPDEYVQLQSLINNETSLRNEYSAPTSGRYQQSVQLRDIDGDGLSEAFAFFRDSSQTLRICVYRSNGVDFSRSLVIDGEGASIGSIDYADLDSDGIEELIVAWQTAAELRILMVYSLSTGENLLTSDSSAFLIADMDDDLTNELICIRFDSKSGGSVDHYIFDGNGYELSSAPLTSGVTSCSSAHMGDLTNGETALFIDGSFESGLITDVFVLSDGKLKNITMRSGKSPSSREYSIDCYDINDDGVIEIPSDEPIESETGNLYRVFDWYSCSSAGRLTFCASTYHCYNDGWYIIIPNSFRRGFTVRRADGTSGEKAVVLSVAAADGEITDFLKIYTFTGDNRRERAAADGRFILMSDNSTIYAAEILSGNLSHSQIHNSFNLIHTEWTSGIS